MRHGSRGHKDETESSQADYNPRRYPDGPDVTIKDSAWILSQI